MESDSFKAYLNSIVSSSLLTILTSLKSSLKCGEITTMNAITKIAILSTGLLSLGALTACQTTTAPKTKEPHAMKHHEKKKLNAEKHEALKKQRMERKQLFENMQNACEGKPTNSSVQVKAGEKVIDGTCKIIFKADRKETKKERTEKRLDHGHMRSEHRPMRGEVRGMNHLRGEILTDTKRAELVQAYDQRLAQRQQQQQAIAQACVGQSAGNTVNLKIGERTTKGICKVRFYPSTKLTQPIP